jgi:hypothetical protein
MSTVHILYLGNNSIVDVTGLRNDYTGAFVADAALSMTLLDTTGAPVGGANWPIPFQYLPDSHGVYRATLPHTLAIAEGGRYIARIVADATLGLRAQWDLPCVGRLRT